ncbi:MAG: bifunctional phosphopantothenoylcysteine decarboxylase/phosphopantothenate--cysteine ligase CoaBC [Bacteroides sp.]|nr:bifunctional phosphopantothenoylcysteine decarboxylase/phosphopantothenate--cysteine ligase CoaBC [Bacteroides sp.]
MTDILKGKKIVLGITGSIAAYKACYIIRGLIKRGAEVQVVITPAGKEFITPITLSALTSKPVISEFFAQRDGTWNSHVDLGLWADAMLIAPATASTIGKMANGIADNMLITTYLSAKAPVFVAPAMDLDMYAHPSTQKNLDTLRSYGNHIIEPGTGELASHLVGKGRMEEPDVIIRRLEEYFAAKEGDLVGKTILITTGPTYEKIDPVRFIGNYSSGKMGFALADECAARGAKVILVTGPVQQQTHYQMLQRHDVESAEQMYEAAVGLFGSVDAAILSAAVADYTPEQVAERKIKREKTGDMTLNLKPTRDIAACLGDIKKSYPKKVLVGFALETNDEQHNAEDKLNRKNLDFIVLNSLNDKGAGFRCDTNKISIIDRNGKTDFPLKSKAEVAVDIVNKLATVLKL